MAGSGKLYVQSSSLAEGKQDIRLSGNLVVQQTSLLGIHIPNQLILKILEK